MKDVRYIKSRTSPEKVTKLPNQNPKKSSNKYAKYIHTYIYIYTYTYTIYIYAYIYIYIEREGETESDSYTQPYI